MEWYLHILMKKNLLFACSLLTLPLLSYEGENNAFAIWGDVAFFRRAQGNNNRLIIDEGHGHLNSCNRCKFEHCNSDKLVSEFDYEPGFQVGIAYLTRHSILEAKYLWIEEWESSCHKSGRGSIFFSEKHPHFTHDFSGADKASAHYKSQFQNGEVNYFWYVTPRRDDYFSAGWLAGVRYINLRENLEIEFHKGSNESSYRIHTWNHIPAIQAGGIIGWNPTSTISWDLNAKAGIGFDWSRQHTFLGDLNNTVTLRDYRATKFSTPFLAEACLAFTYRPWNYINLHIAYEFIYLNGITLAPGQIDKSSEPHHRCRAIGQAFFHGWTAGVTFSF